MSGEKGNDREPPQEARSAAVIDREAQSAAVIDREAQSAAVIDRDVLLTCYADAAQAYPEEACGLLIGPRDTAVCDEARLCRNQQNQLHADDPQTYPRDARMGYNLSRADVEFLDRSLTTARPVKVIYHSHVDVGAYFSAEDQRAALIWGEPLFPVDYLVIDCGPEGVRCARLFRFADGAYVEAASYPGQSEL